MGMERPTVATMSLICGVGGWVGGWLDWVGGGRVGGSNEVLWVSGGWVDAWGSGWVGGWVPGKCNLGPLGGDPRPLGRKP